MKQKFIGTVVNHGVKHAWKNNSKCTASFTNKYLMDTKLWFQYWTDDEKQKFFDLNTLPCSGKLKRLIGKHYKKDDRKIVEFMRSEDEYLTKDDIKRFEEADRECEKRFEDEEHVNQ